jgi:hypothetical protein
MSTENNPVLVILLYVAALFVQEQYIILNVGRVMSYVHDISTVNNISHFKELKFYSGRN